MSSESSLIYDISSVRRRRGAVDAGVTPTVLPTPPFLDCLPEKVCPSAQSPTAHRISYLHPCQDQFTDPYGQTIPDCPDKAVLTPQVLQRPPATNLCWNCRDIPLGLFLCGKYGQSHIHYGDADLDIEGLESIAESAASGCHLCNLLYDALMFADELRLDDPQRGDFMRERKFIDLTTSKDGNLMVSYCATGRKAQLKWHNAVTREGCQTRGQQSFIHFANYADE